MSLSIDQAYAIKIGNGYFSGYDKDGGVVIKHYLSDARLIGRFGLSRTLIELSDKGYECVVKIVELQQLKPQPVYSVREYYQLHMRLERLIKRDKPIPAFANLNLSERISITSMQWTIAMREHQEVSFDVEIYRSRMFDRFKKLSLAERLDNYKFAKRHRQIESLAIDFDELPF